MPKTSDDGELVMVATCDMAGIVRGKAVPRRDLAGRLASGIGWVPANQTIDPFGGISADTPYGALGDLRLMPLPETEIRIGGDDGPGLGLMLSDIVETDGSPWACCPRGFLARALDALEQEFGLTLQAAFEQEFTLSGLPAPTAAFSFRSLQMIAPLAARIEDWCSRSGVPLEQLLPEYGAAQYEITHKPLPALTAADHCVLLRQIVDSAARAEGLAASFSPKPAADGIGNGVHIHFSFRDRDGRPATGSGLLDGPEGPVSPAAGRFAAGVIRHMPALCALTAPSPPSYLRLVPHTWSAAYASFGYRDREVALRISPVLTMKGMDPAEQANLEYRPADATASPYLALGAMVNAGLAGLRERLPAPPLTAADPDMMSAAERMATPLTRLPASLSEALAALEADPVALAWLPPAMRQAYFGMKRDEVKAAAGMTAAALCTRYAGIY